MTNELDEMRMSQLADGELASDEANELLLDTLDDASARDRLKNILRLRQSTVAWRTREPEGPVLVLAERSSSFHHSRIAWRAGGLALAACVGGLLVLAGIWAAGLHGNRAATDGVVSVTPEQMQQVAKVFAFHESVAGPLAWYAADDQNTRLASARGTEVSQQPIGIMLKLQSATPGAAARTLVIVCRNDQPAVVELPAESGDHAPLRVYLTPRTASGKVDVQYAIAVDGQPQQAPLASLTGQRRLGLAESPLGQLAMGDRVLNIEAAAWPMSQERK